VSIQRSSKKEMEKAWSISKVIGRSQGNELTLMPGNEVLYQEFMR